MNRVFAVLLSLLTSCAAPYSVQYRYLPPMSDQGGQCLKRCAQSQQLCQTMCQRSVCIAKMRQVAKSRYQRYWREQQRMGQQVKWVEEDFFEPSRCFVECGCEQDYHACYQLCGGQIVQERVLQQK